MNFKLGFKLMVVCAVLALPIGVAAQSNTPPLSKRSCHNEPRMCVQRMIAQAKQIRVYLVAHVKPGDPVEFNPQPDPPGDPDPWYRQANQAYFGLTQDFADLSRHESELPILNPSDERRASFHNALENAQEKLSLLGQRSDRQALEGALTAFTNALNRISPMLARK